MTIGEDRRGGGKRTPPVRRSCDGERAAGSGSAFTSTTRIVVGSAVVAPASTSM
jgi:hypothetical protein